MPDPPPTCTVPFGCGAVEVPPYNSALCVGPMCPSGLTFRLCLVMSSTLLLPHEFFPRRWPREVCPPAASAEVRLVRWTFPWKRRMRVCPQGLPMPSTLWVVCMDVGSNSVYMRLLSNRRGEFRFLNGKEVNVPQALFCRWYDPLPFLWSYFALSFSLMQ